jgi:hypothetical protein
VADILVAIGQVVTRGFFGKNRHTVLMLADGYRSQRRLYPTYLAALRDGPSLEAAITTHSATESGFEPTLVGRVRRRRSG